MQENSLVPAKDLAKKRRPLFPGESDAYRAAREALLENEIEFRRHMTRLTEQRQALPPGPVIAKNYRFKDENAFEVGLLDLFGDKDTLVTYFWMYGPQRERPCPMCTSLLSSWEGEAQDIEQNVALAIIAQSPLEKMLAFKKERGWRNLKIYSDPNSEYSKDYYANTPEWDDTAAFHVFTRRDGTIRHFYGGEMGFETADPGQDPRGAPDLMPLWTVLDATPAGRRDDWYPSLEYGR